MSNFENKNLLPMQKILVTSPCKDICIHLQTSSGSGDLSGGGLEEINFVIFFLCHHNHGTKMFFLSQILWNSKRHLKLEMLIS